MKVNSRITVIAAREVKRFAALAAFAQAVEWRAAPCPAFVRSAKPRPKRLLLAALSRRAPPCLGHQEACAQRRLSSCAKRPALHGAGRWFVICFAGRRVRQAAVMCTRMGGITQIDARADQASRIGKQRRPGP